MCRGPDLYPVRSRDRGGFGPELAETSPFGPAFPLDQRGVCPIQAVRFWDSTVLLWSRDSATQRGMGGSDPSAGLGGVGAMAKRGICPGCVRSCTEGWRIPAEPWNPESLRDGGKVGAGFRGRVWKRGAAEGRDWLGAGGLRVRAGLSRDRVSGSGDALGRPGWWRGGCGRISGRRRAVLRVRRGLASVRKDLAMGPALFHNFGDACQSVFGSGQRH